MMSQTYQILDHRHSVSRLLIPIGLAILILTALLGGFSSVVPVHADSGDLYVDGTTGQDILTCGDAASPCRTLFYTLDNQAVDGDTILISAGTYTENLTIDSMMLTLRGGYTIDDGLWFTGTGETVLNGDNYDRVFKIVDSNIVLENLTITGGYAYDTNGDGGGGILVENSSITMTNSILINNTVFLADGGGLAAYGDSIVVLTDVDILNNQVDEDSFWGYGGGLYVGGGTQATLKRVEVTGNAAMESGGGLYLESAETTVVIHQSQIISNKTIGDDSSGGGLSVQNGGNLTVLDSRIANNSTKAHGGAINASQATLSMTNVLVTGNQASSGNANVLAIGDSEVSLLNSTIASNNPGGAQAVLVWENGLLDITNSILWNNALNLQADPPCPSCIQVNYSNIQEGWSPGVGNIKSDPAFVGGGDFHLQSGSLCIDAGTDAGAPDHDLDQNQRPQDGNGDRIARTDMGAYEVQLNWIFLPILVK